MFGQLIDASFRPIIQLNFSFLELMKTHYGKTYGRTDGRADPLIEKRGRI